MLHSEITLYCVSQGTREMKSDIWIADPGRSDWQLLCADRHHLFLHDYAQRESTYGSIPRYESHDEEDPKMRGRRNRSESRRYIIRHMNLCPRPTAPESLLEDLVSCTRYHSQRPGSRHPLSRPDYGPRNHIVGRKGNGTRLSCKFPTLYILQHHIYVL